MGCPNYRNNFNIKLSSRPSLKLFVNEYQLLWCNIWIFYIEISKYYKLNNNDRRL